MIAGVKRMLQRASTTARAGVDLASSKWVLVVGDSMYPTLRDGQRVRVSRIAYRNRHPQRWDIVYFEHPQRQGFWQVKRIVGLPNESMRVWSKRLVIDDVEIEDRFAFGGTGFEVHRRQLGPDEYFVMGDNRDRSTDSRDFGEITRNRIVGKVILDDDGSGNDE